MKRKSTDTKLLCPCGGGKTFATCCEPWILGKPAPSAEALMRSRYTAYVQQNEDYLIRTWHSSTCPSPLDISGPDQPKWLELRVLSSRQIDETHATVEFIAYYRQHGRGGRLHEVSRFALENGVWLYLDGDLKST